MRPEFDMAVIGGGAAGLTAAGISASLGAKTALIEPQRLGGDCTWYGCVPSKALLKAAKVAHLLRTADRFGLPAAAPEVQLDRVLGRLHAIQNQIYEDADAPPNLERLGVEVIAARARFIDPHTLELSDGSGQPRRLSSRYFVVATGSRPSVPPIEGLESSGYLTNETIFSIGELPRQLVVIGAGPIGLELAQAFSRLGSRVTVLEYAGRIAPHDDAELAGMLQQHLQEEGIRFCLKTEVRKVDGRQVISSQGIFEADALLIAAGRRPSFGGLDLERAGVAAGPKGISVDRHCRTSARNIYAAGDVTGWFAFTHMAEHMSKVAVSNALLKLPLSLASHATWCTYTDPELAHTGSSQEELRRQGREFETYRFPFSKIDRAVTDGETAGLILVFARRFDGKIYGASILGAHAGEMIAEFALALRHGIRLRQIADTIHAYPTFMLGNRRAADQWYVRKQSPTLVRWLQRIFGYRGRLPDASDPNRVL